MKKKEFIRLLEKKIKGHTSHKEDETIGDTFDQLQDRGESWNLNEREELALRDGLKFKIEQAIEARKISSFSIIDYWKWAASLFLLLSLTFLYYHLETEKEEITWMERETDDHQKATIQLSDGSLVYMNTNSKILFPEEFGPDKRQLILEGEAFFEVSKKVDHPFEVLSREVVTEVLGTAFNVNAQQGMEVEVVVQSGSVEVHGKQSDQQRPTVLGSKQMAIISEGRPIKVEDVNIDEYLGWKAETISFDLESFDQVVKRLSRLYHITIDLKGRVDENCRVKATYSNESLFTVLYGLKNLVDFDFKKTGDHQIVMEFKRCKN